MSAGNPKRIALVASILGSGIVFLDGTIVNVALPSIRASLHGGLADEQWVVEAYLLTLSSLLLVAGSTPLQAGLSLLPITILIFALSKRFGMLADRFGPHLFMAGGPLVAGLGLLLLVRTGAGADYLTTIFPGIAVFGLGMAATVAPLTATVLGSVEPGHSGVASGINNLVARVASLLAIAALGAAVSGSFVDHDLSAYRLSAQTQAVVQRDRTRPLVVDVSGLRGSDRTIVRSALVDSSVHAFRIGIGIGAGLALLGGIIALVGIENPRRRVPAADCPGGALAGAGAATTTAA